jgi:transcription initiation factor TFIID TATA-box-binding protein
MSKKRKRVPPAKEMCITNIVSMCTLISSKRDLPIETVRKAIHGKFSKRIFPAVVSRLKESSVTLCWFSSRVVVCTGARTRDDAIISHNFAAYQVSKQLGMYHKVSELDVTNIVTASKLGYQLNMEEIDKEYSSCTIGWRPRVFAGMKIPVMITVPLTDDEIVANGGALCTKLDKQIKVTFIVFENGNINVTGIKSELHVPHVERVMQMIFSEYAIE